MSAVTWRSTDRVDSAYEEEFDDETNRLRHRLRPVRREPRGLMRIYWVIAEEWQQGSAPP